MVFLIFVVLSMVLGLLGLKYIESGIFAAISALMVIIPLPLTAGLIGTAMINRQVKKHIRGE